MLGLCLVVPVTIVVMGIVSALSDDSAAGDDPFFTMM